MSPRRELTPRSVAWEERQMSRKAREMQVSPITFQHRVGAGLPEHELVQVRKPASARWASASSFREMVPQL